MASTGEQRGRHRLTGAGVAWPAADDSADDTADDRAGDTTADTVVLPLPVVLLPDPTPRRDRPATGLAKFDLGTIPASVTPPRSWRRAAWFSVGAAILVVVGLSFAAVVLMSAPRDPGRVDALPGLPSGEPLLPPETTSKPADPTRPTGTRANPTSAPTSAGERPSDAPSASSPVPQTPTGTVEPTAGAEVTDTSATWLAEPSRTTVNSPVLLAPPSDPMVMGDRTELYFRQVAEDPAAAYALTSGSLRQAGPEAIERRYAAVDRVDVTGIVIDPARATTTARLRVVGKDGSVSEVDRELTFSYGADPRITAERPAG